MSRSGGLTWCSISRELSYRKSHFSAGGQAAINDVVTQRGPPDSPYAGGEYHGVLLFPSEYPFKPPGIKVRSPSCAACDRLLTKALFDQMYTPSGRFQPDKKICFSMSDFHPGTVSFSRFEMLSGPDSLRFPSLVESSMERADNVSYHSSYDLRVSVKVLGPASLRSPPFHRLFLRFLHYSDFVTH